jgi:AcrR family transcriptional regulator
MTQHQSSTADRILDASLKLFNEHGLHDVPALKVAQHLGISPGHLAYHFKTRADIVMAVFQRLEDAVRLELLSVERGDKPLAPAAAAQHQIRILRTLWRYRFFFNALNQVLGQDVVLRERYVRMQSSIIEMMAALFDELIACQSMRAVAKPNSTRLLARACWMVWLSWLRFAQIEDPDNDEISITAVQDGVMQTFSIIQPYFSPAFERDMLKELRRTTRGKAASNSAAARA